MDDALLHMFRNLLRLVLQRVETPFVGVERPPTVEVEGPLAVGGGVVPAVGGTIVERPSLEFSSIAPPPGTPPSKSFEPKINVEVKVEGDKVIVGEGVIYDHFGNEITVRPQIFDVPKGDIPFTLVCRKGKILWSVNVLPTDIPLYPPKRTKMENGGEKDGKD